ncbi:MAG: zinc-ribbon domain-containing protein [Lachnospiraceae bacterium]|nr:zinc-ribbon domain-containing protein [Lachnospiraceae bacterium]
MRDTLAITVPEIIDLWDKEKNEGVTPDQVSMGSSKKYHMYCPSCHTPMLRTANNAWRKKADGTYVIANCKACSCRETAKKRTKLSVDVCPEIRDWWDADLNEGVNLEILSSASRKKFHFKCPVCSTKLYRPMSYFLQLQPDGSYKPAVCQSCFPTKAKNIRLLTEAVPDIEMFWDYERNNDKKPSDFTRTSSEKVFTFCPICHKSVQRTVRFTWFTDEHGVGHVLHCRSCGKRTESNTLTELFPDITNYWDYERNEKNPQFYTISSGERVYLRCPECTETKHRAICDAIQKNADGTYRMAKCISCAKPSRPKTIKMMHAPRVQKTLQERCPDLDTLWDRERNTLKPEDVKSSLKEPFYLHCPTCGKSIQRTIAGHIDRNGNTWRVRPCKSCVMSEANLQKGLKYSGSLRDSCPEIEEWWDYKNNACTPDNLTHGSKVMVNLVCPSCRAKSTRSMHSLLNRNQEGKLLPAACASCGYSSKGNPKDNLLSICPEIVDWWDYERNAPHTPEEFTRGSGTVMYLICPDCGLELHTGIHSLLSTDETGVTRISHTGRCMKYRNRDSENNILKKYPDVTRWWDDDKNIPNRPEDYTIFSRKKFYFHCPDCKTETYRRASDAFLLQEDGLPVLFHCPYCSGIKPIKGVNSLSAVYPELATECISSEDPERILASSTSRMHWKCRDCGHTWYSLLSDRVAGLGCPYCESRKILTGMNDLATTDPELAKEWSPNNDLPATKVIKDRQSTDLWICPTCHGEYPYIRATREVGDKACPFCNNRRALEGFNDLATTHPELAKEWSPNNDRRPQTVLKSNVISALWLCPTCHGEYAATISEREVSDKACPFCNNRRALEGFNDLATTHPELAKEWSPNNDRRPQTVLKSNVISALWLCPTCHGEYAATISEREVGDNACPYCNGRKILPGYNSFKTRHPELMHEWVVKANMMAGNNPDLMLDTSTQDVWWHCNKCNYKYTMSISKRLMKQKRGHNPCPRCNGRPQKRFHFF